jgi:hypothetical protein
MLTRYSNVELADCTEREVHKRRRVYCRLVIRSSDPRRVLMLNSARYALVRRSQQKLP